MLIVGRGILAVRMSLGGIRAAISQQRFGSRQPLLTREVTCDGQADKNK
jgi:hypothetical protein